MIRTLLFIFVVLVIGSANAQDVCWEDAGSAYGIDPLLLKAIAWKESRGWTGAMGPKLADGNRAIGVMQINTVHSPVLAKNNITKADLLDPCISQRVGAWVLADCMQKFGATWKAVGCYNTGPRSNNIDAQVRYVRDVRRYYEGYLNSSTKQTILADSTADHTQ